MIYDELIGEIYWVIGKIQSDPELEEETDARIELNQVITELEQIADLTKEPDIRQYLFEIKAELGIVGITAE
ncbi:hypothetical protein IV451_13230 [Enterococcus faecalis]|uniref:hypothetical protein n=1 Tax=Enterococcus faecalis TaxID=1351 RepID=UPI000DEAEF65|nr:hypothetical protein [Enterococcus faecalis]EGO2658384.1 hypothetical protein [Enterococcus faecalis]EHQ2598504.1 hypothetical protein [Enterococcus faecalis]EHQ8822730.1 hypothetical protein [Enterococcus faecalis]EHZ5371714.1 hypothetical protein [Enterococcus faecalis]EIW2075280.1 hypothetical protein [Enterococcus faecalis]